jgi:hypothetical protein
VLALGGGQDRSALGDVVVTTQAGACLGIVAKQQCQRGRIEIALAKNGAQFEQHWRGGQLVARDLVARDVGERDVLARRKQGFEEHVQILLAAIDVAHLASVRAQVELVATGGARKCVLTQAEHEHGAEGNRAHGHERGNCHAG